jgi:hypothetical protein
MVRTQIIQSFVARVWLERTADKDPKWRGHIQHIQGPEEIYFQDLSEMSAFLELISGVPSPALAPKAGKVVSIAKRKLKASSKRKPDK